MSKQDQDAEVIDRSEFSIDGAKRALWRTIEDLQEGRISPGAASAITNAVGKIVSCINVQIAVAKLTGENPPQLLQLEAVEKPE